MDGNMAELLMVLQFLYIYCQQAWSFMFSIWFIAVPIFAALIFSILRLVWSIAPSNANRKH